MEYPNPPVVFVALEVRLPPESGTRPFLLADQRDLQRSLAGTVDDGWVVDRLQPQALHFTFSPGGVVQAPIPPTAGPVPGAPPSLPRLVSRSKTTAITFAPAAIILETTAHRSWEHLRSILDVTVEFAAERLTPDGYVRLGLRYVDEIRVPTGDASPTDWSRYLSSTLVAPPAPSGFESENWQSVIQYSSLDERHLTLRYGLAPSSVVQTGSALRRPAGAPDGPCFVVDTDAFVVPSDIPPFDAGEIVAACDRLHGPISELFESLVTSELRAIFNQEG